jgi:hypothetical protein
MNYILNGKIPVLEKDILKWAMWLSTADRHVAKTDIVGPAGEKVWVSTVFLGIDHDYRFGYEPVLFETMVFGGEFSDYMRRYKTWAEAEAGHNETVEMVKYVNVN